MQEFLGAVAIMAGFVCAVHYGLGLNGREVPAGECLRLAAFLVMIGAGSLYPIKRGGDDADEEL
jgi:hypothetical protein